MTPFPSLARIMLSFGAARPLGPHTLMTPFAGPHCVSYFKRFKMEAELVDAPPAPALPEGYVLWPWSESLLHEHAEALYASFHEGVDSIVFPSLGDRSGCYYLMQEISRKYGFLPGATWLLAGPDGYCGTVQGICESRGLGAIQNIGIVPSQRNRGLGTLLLLQALEGFRRAGLARAMLEVTAQNEGAIRLYRRLGFARRKTVYKAVVSG